MASPAPVGQSSLRSDRLFKYLGAVLSGKRSVKNVADARLLLEAICDQQDHSNCVEKLIASPSALESLRIGLRSDISAEFINGNVAPFLKYLSDDPVLRQLCNGQLLQQLLFIIADPPTLWNALVQLHKDRLLARESVHSFAWLLLELISLPVNGKIDVREAAQRVTDDRSLLDAPYHEIRTLGHKIRHVLLARSSGAPVDIQSGPGGRHDNDFADFREIAILPTQDEFISKEKPFYRPSNAIDEASSDRRVAIHLDNQFRLLREDMLGELRSDFQIATGQKRGRRSTVELRGLSLEGIECGTDRKRKPFALTFSCETSLRKLSDLPAPDRKAFLDRNRYFLKHRAFGCLIIGTEIVAFATVDRNEDLLVKDIPVVVLQPSGSDAVQRILVAAKQTRELRFISVDTPIFAYEPVLKRLQDMSGLPMAEELLSWVPTMSICASFPQLDHITQRIADSGGHDLHNILETPKSIDLDKSQMESLLAGLTQTLSLIQGPPGTFCIPLVSPSSYQLIVIGTGKSFIGALLAKVMHDHTKKEILVICYTNHALDQFLLDLLDIGIPAESMVRLGAKYIPPTKHLSLSEQLSNFRRSKASHDLMDMLGNEADDLEEQLQKFVAEYRNFDITLSDTLEYLQFSEEDGHFFSALSNPAQGDDMTRVDRRGKAVQSDYLIRRWSKGQDPGVFRDDISQEHAQVWEMDPASRHGCFERWRLALLEEQAVKVHHCAQRFNFAQKRLNDVRGERDRHIISEKRIIGCTTTAAAKYTRELQCASPGVILVEEAGEILESHILTATTPDTEQLILIGDHQQLRPKVSNYALTVEKGDGFDLNRSLFERLVLAGFPHTKLRKQHRMCPEISSLVRHLTYPDLLDSPRTSIRDPIRGLQGRVIFFNHDYLEVEIADVADRRDQESKSSKQNNFEVDMVLQCVRYLGQQGYGTNHQVILTPYLGQLRLLRDRLSEENDPVLNDLDSFDLVRAGLLPPASAHIRKNRIQISTIDNYQGEESDIVIVTLTRSNKAADIGFMAAPQRLNVLLSRARNALIIIGNADTFKNSRKGKTFWVPFLNYLSDKGLLYDGLPVKCERHPDKRPLLQCKEDFQSKCPDGGCSDPCGAKLSCGVHDCPQRCHQLYNHTKVQCQQIVESICAKNHKLSWKCFEKRPAICRVCDDEARRLEEKRQRGFKLETERQAKQREYAQQLALIEEEINHERRLQRDRAEQNERDRTLLQRQKDLADLKTTNRQTYSGRTFQPNKSSPSELTLGQTSNVTSAPEQTLAKNEKETIPVLLDSSAKDEWEHQKEYLGQQNEALDEIMSMVGLEDVKEKFLSIKGQVDTAVRQNIEMKEERFSATLLGNPGTGKTTVARLYGRFLSSVGALPGSCFVETTGSRLASDGVPGCKKQIEEIMNNGGGALFIDEAYQLVLGHNHGGRQVLDFLLGEVENLTGKVVFILAGYSEQMEAFFAHNPGLVSRFPHELQFADYDSGELLQILQHRVNKKYGGRMKVEGGIGGLYARIVARRIGRGRGREGFGNARAVANAFDRVMERQANRLRRERRNGLNPNDLEMTKEDLLGPEPSKALKSNASWSKLSNLIGLQAVKQSVQALMDSIHYNYCRELAEEPLVEYSLNRVFLGSPGTGKTSVAKLYGQILVDIGLLSSGQGKQASLVTHQKETLTEPVIVKNPADFTGSALGQSEEKTKGILASTVGKVLVIDEAYGLYGNSGGGSGGEADIYKKAVIDTIVAEVQGTPGEDRCVLLLGYKDQIEEMFQNVNPGLSRRFPLDSAFVFEDFTATELRQILELKLKGQGYEATDQAKHVAMEVLRRARNRPHFGNAGEVDILLNAAKMRHQQRLTLEKLKSATLEARDIDPDFDRGERAVTNVRMLFKGVVACEEIVSRLEGYQRAVANTRARDMDPLEQIPFNFLFRGPPGTGKTTTAKKMAKVYYDMGFLANADVVECSATNLVGQYIGQTGPKTQKLLEKSLGRVLIIDEAYRLAEGQFAKEAMDELVDSLTKPKFAQKLITILAGYDAEINHLMSVNPGLTSRFPETIGFRGLSPEECLELFKQLLQKQKLDASILDQPGLKPELIGQFDELSKSGNWANARDVKTLSNNVFRRIMNSAALSDLTVKAEVVIEEMGAMISERSHRSRSTVALNRRLPAARDTPKIAIHGSPDRPPPTIRTTRLAQSTSTIKADLSAPPPPEPTQTASVDEDPPRDTGVSDAVWNQLQQDKLAAKVREEEYQNLIAQERALEKELSQPEPEFPPKDDEDANNRAALEAERIRNELARRQLEEEMEKIERERREMDQKRKKEAEAQKKLRKMGVCCMGFSWVKQQGGWRCRGGTHWVNEGELEQA
ncbi:hypothetical protein GP486_002829 [Trichoglossum hirsutum]|uniref:AAA+ ATPase domain-containing protein n=1 Tax=Trichoglossum hirsutum TaxID=265104 RepID=A0A9P8RRB2_9PEZI|nr:hypothetical protein GP486_002829 [Trichoglossum hirsutum]